MRLKNESTTFPPGGLQFHERQLGWKNTINDPVTVWSWDGLVNAIYTLRMQNRARFPKLNIDRTAIRIEISEQNANRIAGMAGADTYLMPGTAYSAQGGPASNPQPPHANVPVNVAVGSRIAAIARGAASLGDWVLKEGGKLVPLELAEKRASICAECPKNSTDGLDSWFTVPASNMIRKRMEAFSERKIETSKDDQLNVCEACTCPLRLAIHEPIAIKLKHLGEVAKNALWTSCWILAEEKEMVGK